MSDTLHTPPNELDPSYASIAAEADPQAPNAEVIEPRFMPTILGATYSYGEPNDPSTSQLAPIIDGGEPIWDIGPTESGLTCLRTGANGANGLSTSRLLSNFNASQHL